jgi:hypothetical protein
MLILIVTPYMWTSSKPSGLANSIKYLAHAMSINNEINILSSDVGIKNFKNDIDHNIKVIYYRVIKSKRILFSLDFFFKAFRSIKKCDILVLNEFFSISTITLIFLNKIFNKKIIFFPRGSMIFKNYSAKKKLYKFFFSSFLIENVSVAIFTSDFEFQNAPLFKNHSIIYNCYLPNKKIIQFNKDSLPKSNILYINEISDAKGFVFLFNSWKKLKSSTTINLKLIVAGEVLPKFKKQFHEFEKSFDLLNIEYIGVVDSYEKEKLYSYSSLTVLTSYSENFSNIVIESLSQGVPVLATYGTPWQSLVDYNCGYYIDHNTDLFVAKIIQHQALSEESVMIMKNNAINYFNTFYNFEIFKKNIDVVLNLV